MTPVEFPAGVGGWPQTVMAGHIESIECHYYYREQSILVLTSKRRIHVGCSAQRAAELIRLAGAQR